MECLVDMLDKYFYIKNITNYILKVILQNLEEGHEKKIKSLKEGSIDLRALGQEDENNIRNKYANQMK